MVLRPRARVLAGAVVGSLCLMLVCAPAASAVAISPPLGPLGPIGLPGLPSLHSIIEAIAKGFFSDLAGALVPGFLKHGTIATIQHLVALPDPATWGHVGELQSDMAFLGMSLMPVTLTVCTLRYWMIGLTGAAHPVSALGRCASATGVLVIYRWLVEQTVAATNTLTHAILGFPVVAGGLASIITVLFGGALLVGAGGVFGAFLVIVGVVFAAALFASSEALTVLLALVFCAGPPFIALSPIPELSHLARAWSHALLAIMLVPIGWTILFATAGALTLDAASVTHGAGGLPGHIAAAFAGLITFILAVKLPMMLFGELRHILGGALRSSGSPDGSRSAPAIPGAELMRAAHARLRTFAVEGMPALGRSAGRAAGAIGAPEGGPLGVARRGLAGAARRTGLVSGMTPAAAGAGAAGGVAAAGVAASRAGGARERLTRARTILAGAPREARTAMRAGPSRAARTSEQRGARSPSARSGSASATKQTPARIAPEKAVSATVAGKTPTRRSGDASPTARPAPRPPATRAAAARVPASGSPPRPAGTGQSTPHPGQKVTNGARRDASASPPASTSAPKGGTQPPPRQPPEGPPTPKPRKKPSSRRPREKGKR